MRGKGSGRMTDIENDSAAGSPPTPAWNPRNLALGLAAGLLLPALVLVSIVLANRVFAAPAKAAVNPTVTAYQQIRNRAATDQRFTPTPRQAIVAGTILTDFPHHP